MNKISPLARFLQTKVGCAIAGLATIVLFRLITLPFPDLMDTTEGRYATVAKLMLDRDDWVTPWINFAGVEKPYLGKPPLHFWLMDIAYLVFGQNNFAARFPSFLSAVGIGISVWITAAAILSIESAIVATCVVASSCLLFFLGGAVILDVTLTLGITIALGSFIIADRSKIAGYLFFAGLALGVLVKGPLACVLVGVVVVPWALIHKLRLGTWPLQLSSLPWIGGILLFLALVLPWYIWAEIRNPGFLKYFLWNENFGRYFKSEYGDEYGTGHRQPFGAAWGMLVLALFPWSFVFLVVGWYARKHAFTRSTIVGIAHDPVLLFSAIWAVSCPLLLLGAKQYTGTYLMPSIPGFAILAGTLWERHCGRDAKHTRLMSEILRQAALVLSVAFLIGPFILVFFSASIPIAIVSALSGALALTLSRRLADAGLSAVRVAVITGLLFSCATLCMNNSLSNNRSSRRILTRACDFSTPGSTLRVGFIENLPFSTAFYGPLMSTCSITSQRVTYDQVAQSGTDLLVIRERNLKRIPADVPKLTELARVGQWLIFRGIGTPRINEPG